MISPRASAGLGQGSLAPTLFGWGITGHVVADLCVLLRLQYKAERPVLVQYYRYGTTGTVLHLPVPGYWYDYPVQFTVQNYRYQYYCPIYRYSFISTAVSNHSSDYHRYRYRYSRIRTVIQVISSSIQDHEFD